MRRAWVLAALVVAAAHIALPAEAARGQKLLVAVIDQVTWADLLDPDTDAPVLRRLAEQGGVAMMSVRTAGKGGAYLTIGAGSRAQAASPLGQEGYPEGWAFQATEVIEGQPAAQVYRAYTRWPPGDNAIVHLGVGDLIRQNLLSSYPVTPGALGGALRRAGLRVACVGNADTRQGRRRAVVAIAMDEQGLVSLGEVSAVLARPDPLAPARLATDGPRLLAAFRRAAARADLVVVDVGETSRAEESSQLMSPAAARQARAQAIARADHLLGQLLRGLPETRWAVMALAPTVRRPEPEEQFATLAPIIFRAPGQAPGLLTSPSTRRPGVVANTDIAPTILAFFGVAPARDMVGRPMTIAPAPGGGVAWLKAAVARETAAEIGRRFAFRWVPAAGAVACWLCALLVLLGERAPAWGVALVRGGLLVALSAPGALLAVGAWPLTPWQMAVVTVAIALGLALLGSLLTSWRTGYALPAVVTAALLVYDMVRGAGLLQWSPLSYSATAGARFYGLGNEYGGALLGAALMSVAALSSRRERSSWGERVAATALLVGIVALVGHSRYGANLGMGLACAVGFAVFLAHLWWERPTWRAGVAVLAIVGGVAGVAIGLDVFVKGAEASHMGQLAAAVRAEGWPAVSQVIARKWSMNWLLTRTSLWTELVAAALAVMAAWVLVRPARALAALRRPWVTPALAACAVGALAAWLLNDSGIVAAGLALLYGVGSGGYLALGEPQPEV